VKSDSRRSANETVRVGDLVHVHHNGTGSRWGHVREFFGRETVIDYVNGICHYVPRQYVNRALLGLDGPICLRCTREAQAFDR
jgi:hypothetical protein